MTDDLFENPALMIGSLEGNIGRLAQTLLKNGVRILEVPTVDKAVAFIKAENFQGPVFCPQKLSVSDLSFYKKLILCRDLKESSPEGNEDIFQGAGQKTIFYNAGFDELRPLFDPAGRASSGRGRNKKIEKHEALVISQDKVMQALLKRAAKIAPSDATVLITGESGTGKEVLAGFIHARSERADKPFVAVNCAAIPDSLLESELFGHEKGAFSGAITGRAGKFEAAHGGTLLLDEISEMEPRLQAKLLRVLQEREVERLGGNSKPLPLDVRVLATSNRDLRAEMQKGNFREDLYFRLNVFEFCLPPLRERKTDIIPLADHFAAFYAKKSGFVHAGFDQKALDKLVAYSFRGNVRELENIVQRSVLLAEGEKITADLIEINEEVLTEAV